MNLIRRMGWAAACSVVILFSLSFIPAHATKKLALVIGNADYAIGALDNPVNDANDMASLLEEIGFDEVIISTNASAIEMHRVLREFGGKLNEYDLGLFYYAGHGIQVKGRNYLLPVDADIQAEDEVPFQSIDAGQVLAKMEAAGNPTNLVFLDSCRDNPFARSWRSSTAGLVQMESPAGSLIAYATAPGSTAADGEGRNGVFTGALMQALEKPGEDISIVLRNTAKTVRSVTNGEQVPWVSSSIADEVILNVAANGVNEVETKIGTEAPSNTSVEGLSVNAQTAFWNSISSSNTPGDFDAYLQQWPTGVFSSLAKSRLAALKNTDTIRKDVDLKAEELNNTVQSQSVNELVVPVVGEPENDGKDNAIIVFDGSGSMWGQIDGKTKIEIARDVMGTLVDDWDKNVNLGLIAYGHREKGSCSDIEVLQSVSTIDSKSILKKINNISPKGKTPISQSLRMAADTLRYTEDNATVILVSDGEETCNADPCAVSRELEQQGIDFTAHVIGFDIKGNQKAESQLRCIAESTGGKFFAAEDAASLKNSLNKVKKTVAVEVQTIEIETNIGSLEIANTKDFVTVVDSASGKKKGSVPRADLPVQLASGKYNLEFLNFNIDGVVVIAGKKTFIDAGKFSGWVTLKNTKDFVTVFDSEGDKRKGNIPRADLPVQLAVGKYNLEFKNFTLDDVEVIAGETTVIDASKLSGWVTLKNTKDFVTVLDSDGDKRKGNIPRADLPVQLAVGTYNLEFKNFTLDDVEVIAGETTVIDASKLSGWMTLKNTKDFVTVLNSDGNRQRGNIPRADLPVQLPVGTYNLEFKNFTLDDIEVIAGETTVIDASEVSGWVILKNTKDFVTVFDSKGDKQRGNIPRADLPVQLAVGTYNLEFKNFNLDGIEISAGETRVLDAGEFSGWIMVKNTKEFITVYDQATDKRTGVIPRSNLDVQFSPGIYRLEARSFEIADIVVEAGKKSVLNLE